MSELRSLRKGEWFRRNGYLCEVIRQARRSTFVRIIEHPNIDGVGGIVIQLGKNTKVVRAS